MDGVIIVVGLVIYLKSNKILLNMFQLELSIKNLIAYALLGFLVSGIIMFVNYDNSSKGSVFLYVFYILGLLVQIGYWYFKKPRTINLQNKL